MKYIILLSFFLIFTSCQNEPNSKIENEEAQNARHHKLKTSDFPLETNVSFLSDLIQANNKSYLVYELNIFNNYKDIIVLEKVEICNLISPKLPIATFDSIYINNNFERPGLKNENDLNHLASNQFGVLNLNLEFIDQNKIPEKIFHRLHFKIQKGNGESIKYAIETTILETPSLTKLTIGLPFNKKGKWLYEAEGHKNSRFFLNGKVVYPQRFAIDWIYVENKKFAKNAIKKNEDWYGYGLEIVSVADGYVVDVKDSIIDNEPLSEQMAVRINGETIAGNYVIIDIGNDLYALYGHLIPNSLKVKIGDKIEKGQVIGLLGNSGNSDLPHLHFQLDNKGSMPMGGEGIPYHIKEFVQLKNYSSEEVSRLFYQNHVPFDSLTPVKKNNEFPFGYGLIEVE